ncbi:plasmid pRiA4b ORF-3 family protein [Lacticaseibacillus baoqingensis]|uniref:Plasmid pRiA4b ORF-3 family protein n=1 Tax=Lacticaseibacillus baoqingensis TaxID=2486013 RepID=A0ABW4E938_9LACO|nr:plasmid pRiA4b ORF-3 family protein [Lacticaseibacillus baoqingensis]
MPQALIINVTLKDQPQPTWRRLAIATDTTYAQLHEIIQLAFDWTNSHLWAFSPAGQARQYVAELDPDWQAQGPKQLRAADHAVDADLAEGSVDYEYDFGDSWHHEITLEDMRWESWLLPTCLDGAGDGGLEDGGHAFDKGATVIALNGWGNLQKPNFDLSADSPLKTTMATGWEALQTTGALDDLLSDYTAGSITAILETLGAAMQHQTAAPMDQWQAKQIDAAMRAVHEQASAHPQGEHQYAFFVEVVATFLLCAADQKVLALDMNTVTKLLTGIKAAYPKELDVLEMGFEHPDDVPAIANEDDVRALVKGWTDDFLKSNEYQLLPAGVPVKTVYDFTRMFAEVMYERMAQIPQAWTVEGVWEVVGRYFVTNVILSQQEFQQLGPVLSAFCKYLYRAQRIDEDLAEDVADAGAQAALLAQDETNFGPAKKIGIAMSKANIDPQDKAAVHQFVDDYNRGESAYQPSQDYLDWPHAEKWQRGVATRVHKAAVDNAQAVADELNDQDHVVLDTIVAMVDRMYAAHLQSPQKWQADTTEAVAKRVLQSLPSTQRDAGATWLTTYLTQLQAHSSMSKKKMRELQAAIQAGRAQLGTSGRKLSKKQAKRLLKKRRK